MKVKNRHVWRIAFLTAILAVAWLGCSDDEVAGTGGGGGSNNTATLSAGEWSIEMAFWTCGMTDTSRAVFSDVFCSDDPITDFELPGLPAIPCPLKRDGNNLSLKCTVTLETFPGSGCMVTWSIDVSGTMSATRWDIAGTLEKLSDNPVDCDQSPDCVEFSLTLIKTGDRPSACAYAPARTMNLTVGGGPFAGKKTFDAYGFPNQLSNSISWGMNGSWGNGVFRNPASAGITSESADIGISTDYIDPSTLPVTLTAQVFAKQLAGSFEAASGGGPMAGVTYYEYRSSPVHSFYADGGSGTVTINEMDLDHIAGTMSLNLSGQENGSPSTRSLSGGFFLLYDQFVPASGGAEGVSGENEPVMRLTRAIYESLKSHSGH